MPFPAGHYTALPLVEACNNVKLPSGPFEAGDCKLRLQRHQHEQKWKSKMQGGNNNVATSSALDSSALADDDSDDEHASDESSFDGEFLCPFFLDMPKHSAHENHSKSSNPPSRRPSSHRTSFSRMTPMPQLRSSSPTFSFPGMYSPPEPSKRAQPIGFLRPSIVRALIADNKKMVAMNCKPVWDTLPSIEYPPPARRPSYSQSRPHSRRNSLSATPRTQPGTPSESVTGAPLSTEPKSLRDALEKLNVSDIDVEKQVYAVSFADWVNEEGQECRREHIDRVVRGWKMTGEFAELLDGWRDEEYMIYGPRPETENPLPGSNVAFTMERSACALFGFATFGVHLTAYIPATADQSLRIWVPKRSATKQTWPGYLDNTVAGGISAGDTPFDSIIRECVEEASLDPQFTSNHVRNAGVVVYNYRTKQGWLQPEVQYVYDLELPKDNSIQPRTNDSEVESFELLTLEDVVSKMMEGEFKPNCALVLCDFLMRHGYLTPESDARFLEVASGCRITLTLPGPA
ncbi:hypothetical protein OIV83_005092 [Microbotryomycetes sp. JL201]|nr:hypothetical protein OIV83_005092 [Microbotryomycetes sp. JL201]